MELEPIIGLEIHVALKTKSKLFCRCANIFGDVEPNTAICPICLGYPGTLPVPNQTAIEWAQKAGAALNCELARESKFDRKHYFYPDLPKGYQISQFDQPFCGKGGIEIVVDGTTKTIGITRAHLEDDAAKNTHPAGADHTLVDYNRAGTPLIEIVTEPDLRSPEEAKVFLQELQRIMRAIDVSDADMEKGQLRCDANISLRERGTTKLHPKTEVKNINSFKFVAKALEYEIKRQTKAWAKGEVPQTSATRGFNAKTGKTTAQRTKEEAADYRYFPEPDIPRFEFTVEELAAIRASVPELPGARRTRLVDQLGISAQQAQLFVEYPDFADLFEAVGSELQQLDNEQVDVSPKDAPELITIAANIILRQLREYLTEHDIAVAIMKLKPQNFAELVILVQQGKINQGAITPVLAEMVQTGGDPDHIIEKLGVAQVSDTGELDAYLDEVISENPDVVAKIKAGKDAAIQFLMGQVMAKSRGKADPKVVTDLLRKKLKNK